MNGCSITIVSIAQILEVRAEVRLLDVVVIVGTSIAVSIDSNILLKLGYWRLWTLWASLQESMYCVCMCVDWYTCGWVYSCLITLVSIAEMFFLKLDRWRLWSLHVSLKQFL